MHLVLFGPTFAIAAFPKPFKNQWYLNIIVSIN